MSKRLFDWCLASVGLLLLAPFFLIIAVLIKFDTLGPVFYRQNRVGRHGQLFGIYKFRTMRHAKNTAGLEITIDGDARITRVGQWLRRSKCDELPQLINVWQGSMSLVGPRPEVPSYVALYPPEIKAKILSVRPGITDTASLQYRNESAVLAAATDPQHTYIHEVLPHKLALSARYVDEATLWLDIRIILRTFVAVFRH